MRMKTSVVEIKCDVCGKTTRHSDDDKKSYVELSFEDSHVDRMWYTKHVCGSCAKKIVDKWAAAGHLRY
jgi:hypothetical protein